MINKVEIASVNTAKLPVLTNKEKNELLVKIKNGDNEAREEFAIIVKRNEAVYEVLLELLQFSKKETVKTIAE